MSVTISGTLIDGAGIPLSKCEIYLESHFNTAEIVVNTVAKVTTDENGQYSFEAPTGKYTVQIKQKSLPLYCVGEITVYDDSKPGTLNDFLIALDEGDLKPDVVKRFEELVAQAQQSADMAAESAQQVSQSVQDVTKAKDEAKRYAADAQNSATAAAESQNTAAESEKRAASSAHSATQSAQNAQESKEAAQQAAQNAQNCRNEVEEVANNLANEVQTKAPLDSPALTGSPTAPTPDISATGGEVATAEFVKQAVSALVDSSPEALDTLNELAEALGNDPNFATTMTNALAGKQPLNPILTSLSALATAENKLAYFSNKNVMSLANLSAVGRVIIGQNSKSGVLEYLGALNSTNNLSEIAAAGTDAQQQAQSHLGLGDAATMNVQSDIDDRTDGRLALPGAFGYGAYFRQGKTFSGNNGPAEFLAWVKETPPGRYYVSQYAGNQQIIPGVNFSGMIEIIIPNTVTHNEDQRRKDKLIKFYGINGDLYFNRLNINSTSGDYFIGWENLKPPPVTPFEVAHWLQKTTSGSWYTTRDPDIGGLIMAAYRKSDVTDGFVLKRGDYAYGSELKPCIFTVPESGSVPAFHIENNYIYPGTYWSLTGFPWLTTKDDILGLFVRYQ